MHCAGTLASAAKEWQRIERASVRSWTDEHAVDVAKLYDGFHSLGLQYGPNYRTIVQAWSASDSAAARLRLRTRKERTTVHPADLDDALCMALTLGGGGNGETRLPFAVQDAQLQATRGRLWAVRCARCSAFSHSPSIALFIKAFARIQSHSVTFARTPLKPLLREASWPWHDWV